MSKNKVRYGLSNVYYAVITKDALTGEYKYGTPVAIRGAVSLELSPEGDTNSFYADNGIFYSKSTNNGYSGSISFAMIPDQFRIDVMGERVVAGGLYESADAKQEDIALLFEVDGDEEKSRFVYYDVSVARTNQTANTTAEGTEIEPEELTITVKPRTSDKAIKWVTGDTTDTEIYNSFFTEVKDVKTIAVPLAKEGK